MPICDEYDEMRQIDCLNQFFLHPLSRWWHQNRQCKTEAMQNAIPDLQYNIVESEVRNIIQGYDYLQKQSDTYLKELAEYKSSEERFRQR